jgi:hypothetical protein
MDPLILEIIVGVLILSSFGLAFMVSKSWRVTHVLLLSLVFLTTVVFWYMAARTLKIHTEWRNLANKQKADIAQLQKEIEELRDGSKTDETKQRSLRQLQYELADLVTARGQVWRNVQEAKADAQSGEITLTMADKEHGLADKTIVYVFEGATPAEGGDYLGEFQVKSSNESTVQLAPHLPQTPEQLALLTQTKAPLSLYSTMPTDDPGMLTGLDPARQQAIVPDEKVRQQFAAADRSPRDYKILFHDFHAQREILADENTRLVGDIARLDESISRVATDAKYRAGEKTRLTDDLAGFRREVQIVTDYLGQLKSAVNKKLAQLATSKANAAQLAAAVTALQLQSARAVNDQTSENAAE